MSGARVYACHLLHMLELVQVYSTHVHVHVWW